MRATEELHELQDCVTKIFPWTAQTLKLSEAGEWLAKGFQVIQLNNTWGQDGAWLTPGTALTWQMKRTEVHNVNRNPMAQPQLRAQKKRSWCMHNKFCFW